MCCEHTCVLHTDNASERLPLEQSPNLGAPILPPTESAGSSVLPGTPAPVSPLGALAGGVSPPQLVRKGLFQGFSLSRVRFLPKVPPSTEFVGRVQLGQTQLDTGSRTRLSCIFVIGIFSSNPPSCLPSPAFPVDLGP